MGGIDAGEGAEGSVEQRVHGEPHSGELTGEPRRFSSLLMGSNSRNYSLLDTNSGFTGSR